MNNQKIKMQSSIHSASSGQEIKSEEIVTWISEIVNSAGFTNVVIGLSGGIDSALSTTLAVKALGKEHVYPVLLPYNAMHVQATADARSVIEFLEIPKEHVTQIDIREGVDGILKNVILGSLENTTLESNQDSGRTSFARMTNSSDKIRQGNIMARVRMIYLFDLAKKLGALVCGTENKTEHYLGYFTRFGDEASDIEPIRNLYKTQVWEMAKELDIPGQIIIKAPTAGLWDGQTDENELGFSYTDADRILQLYFDEKCSKEEIIAKGIAEEVVSKVLDRVEQNEFKHKLPYVYNNK